MTDVEQGGAAERRSPTQPYDAYRSYGVRIGDVYLSRHTRGMEFTVERVDLANSLAHGRRNTSRRRQAISLRNLAMANRYTLVHREPDPEATP